MNDTPATKLALAFQLATLDLLKARGYLGDTDLESIATHALALCAAESGEILGRGHSPGSAPDPQAERAG